MNIEQNIESVLFTGEEIRTAVDRLAGEINEAYAEAAGDVVMVCVLKGSAIFFADLVRKVDLPVSLDFVAISSYGMTAKSTGEVAIIKDVTISMTDKHIILVEDIIDTGLTLKYLIKNLKLKKPASIKVCALFDKPSRRKTDFVGNFVGLTVPDEFVVGYGLDFAERYRNLPYLGILKREVYEKDAGK